MSPQQTAAILFGLEDELFA